jgi:threonylcarbamoyladenosine tRNA methylthiotransferase MtaB
MRFAILTLGCKINQYESQRIRQGLVAAGHIEQVFTEPGADCYIINTCTITHKSDAETRRVIRRALRHGSRVIVTGCQVVVDSKGIRDVSEAIEIARPDHLSEILQVDLPSIITGFGDHHRAFVKVQQGCDKYCTYCIVPFARGRPMSRPWQEVVTEVRALIDKGYHEVVITGINIGLYEGGLTRLVERVLSHTSIPRLRISSIEPWTVEDGLISLIKDNPRLCKHLHLPLQHGSDTILRTMGRPYTASYFRSLIDRIRNASPEAAIGMDVIVGFPGEDDKSFEESYGLIEDLYVTYLHVFPFSPRQGTAAALLPGRPDDAVTKQRASHLRALSREKRHAFACSRQGMVEELLVTGVCEGYFHGITSNYLTVQAQGSVPAGNIVSVLLKSMEGQTLTGELLG